MIRRKARAPPFNYTLRSNDVRFDFDVRSSNPPSITLQAMHSLNELVACNNTQKHFLRIGFQRLQKHTGGYTENTL